MRRHRSKRDPEATHADEQRPSCERDALDTKSVDANVLGDRANEPDQDSYPTRVKKDGMYAHQPI